MASSTTRRSRLGSSAPARDSSWPGGGVSSPRGARAISSARVPDASASSSSPKCAWRFVMSRADPASAAVVVQPLGEGLGLAQVLQRPPAVTERDQHRPQLEADLDAPAPAWTWLSGSAARTSSACSNQARGVRERRPRGGLLAGLPGIVLPPSPATGPGRHDGRAVRCARRGDGVECLDRLHDPRVKARRRSCSTLP